MLRPVAKFWNFSIVGLIAKFGKLVKFACSLSSVSSSIMVNFGAKGVNFWSFRIVGLIAKFWKVHQFAKFGKFWCKRDEFV